MVIGQTTVTPAIPTDVSKWIFFGCIIVSFLLLFWDMIKARRILKTKDISYNFTCGIANTYLSIKDYRCYCLFQSIERGIESYAFFVFTTLRGWKRLLLAEAPRQVINIVTLEALVPEWFKIHNGELTINNQALGDSWTQQILTGTMAFSTIIFAMSFILVCAAAVLYVPLICHIRGNLKEYVCHKADKRIDDILHKQRMKVLYRKGPQANPFDETSSTLVYSLEKGYMNDGASDQHLLSKDYNDYYYPKPSYSYQQRPLSRQTYTPQLSQNLS